MKLNPKLFKGLINREQALYCPVYSPFILLAIVLTLSIVYDFHEILQLRPQGTHQWRQCDCLSITASFYRGDADFFQPEIYNLLGDNQGRTISEFPLIYYLVSLLWKIFGRHEWIFRLLNFIISICGMLAILRISERVIRDSFWGLFAAAVFFTSGIYVYYSLNFLMNTIALNMALIGWYFFFRYYPEGRTVYLYLTFFFFLIGGLLKITSLLSFLALCCLFILDRTGSFPDKYKKNIFRNKSDFIIPALLVVITILAWISYVRYYNSMWNKNVFLVGILPVWDLSNQEIRETFENIRKIWLEQYFYRPLHVFFLTGLLSVWIFHKRTEPVLLSITTLLSAGSVSVVVLFFGALGNHDYYMIDLLILSVFIMLSFFYLLNNTQLKTDILHLPLTRILAAIIVVLAAAHTSKEIDRRFKGWHNRRHLTQFYGYAEIEPYLDSIGLGPSKKVISLNDPSINITLYLMDRKGWTQYGTEMKDSTMIARRIRMGAEYLVHHRPVDSLDGSHWKYFLKGEAGRFENVIIKRIGFPDNVPSFSDSIDPAH
ncbi:MAG: glycosyltransferase family 39 protein [Bacteroidales bacterium]